jgi:hypothetical protein
MDRLIRRAALLHFMKRRRFLAGGIGLGATMLAGCSFPRGDSAPEYPGGTLWVSNTYRSDVEIAVTTVDHAPEASVETSVPAGETLIRREFVSAESGEAVTLAATVEGGDRRTFEFLPAGTDDATSEYARLDIETPVSADWSARAAGEQH